MRMVKRHKAVSTSLCLEFRNIMLSFWPANKFSLKQIKCKIIDYFGLRNTVLNQHTGKTRKPSKLNAGKIIFMHFARHFCQEKYKKKKICAYST